MKFLFFGAKKIWGLDERFNTTLSQRYRTFMRAVNSQEINPFGSGLPVLRVCLPQRTQCHKLQKFRSAKRLFAFRVPTCHYDIDRNQEKKLI